MKYLKALIPLLMCSVMANADPVSIEIFADGAVKIPLISNFKIMAYDLNEITYMNQHKPTFKRQSVEASKAAAFEWLNSKDYENYKQQVIRVNYPMMLISKYQLSKIPAIVFNEGEHVIYGTTDIKLAIVEWTRFMEISHK